MDLDKFVGKQLKVVLLDEVFMGCLIFYHKKVGYLVLGDVKNLITNYEYSNTRLFLMKDILRIVSITDNCQLMPNFDESKQMQSVPSSSNSSAVDLDEIINQSKTLLYIKQKDADYLSALRDIRAQSEIAVFLEPESLDDKRNHTMLVTIATYTAVYAFRLPCLQSHWRNLLDLLEERHPRKIIYDYDRFVMKLHRLNVRVWKMKSIIDAAMEYSLAKHSSMKPIDFDEAIEKCFNVEPTFFIHSDRQICRRPVTPAGLSIMAKRAILLLRLHGHLRIK